MEAKPVKTKKLPSLQHIFSMQPQPNNVATLIQINSGKITEDEKKLLDMKAVFTSRPCFYYMNGGTSNCQLNLLVGTGVNGYLNPLIADPAFMTLSLAVRKHIIDEMFLYIRQCLKNSGLSTRSLLLMDLNEIYYKRLEPYLNQDVLKINAPYKSSNNSSMRIVIGPYNTMFK